MNATYVMTSVFLMIVLGIFFVNAARRLAAHEKKRISLILIGATMFYVLMDCVWLAEYLVPAESYDRTLFTVLNFLFYAVYITLPFIWFRFSQTFIGEDVLKNRALNFVTDLPWLFNAVLILLTVFGTGTVWTIGGAEMRYDRGPMFSLFSWLNMVYYFIPVLEIVLKFIFNKEKNRRYLLSVLSFSLVPAAGVFVYTYFIPKFDIYPFQPFCFFLGVVFAYFFLIEQTENLLKAQNENALKEQMARVMSLSDELHAIYDVNVETGEYEYFTYSNEYVDTVLVNMSTGKDFYADAVRNTDKIIYADDRDLVRSRFADKEYVLKVLREQSGFTLEYRQDIAGAPVWYRCKVIKKAGDTAHCLMGVFNIDAQVRSEKEQQKRLAEQMARVMGLSDNFQAIYDVDLETGRYDLFTYENEFTDSVLVNMAKGESFYTDAVKDADLVVYPDDRQAIYDVDYETGKYKIYSYDNNYEQSVLKDNENGSNFYAETLKDVPRVVYAEDRALIINTFSNREHIGELLDRQRSFTIDYRLLIRGEPVWYRVKVARNPGAPDRFLVGIFNIDERKRREEEQRRAEKESTDIISGLASAYNTIYYVDLDSGGYSARVMSDKASFMTALYVKNADFRALAHVFIENLVHPDDRALLRPYTDAEYIRKRLTHSKVDTIRFRRKQGDGYIWMEQIYVKPGNIDEEPHYVISAFAERDSIVRAEMEQQEQLKQALALAETASSAKTAFLNSMSHDIRTPLNAITGYTAMAKKRKDSPEAVMSCLDKIDISSKHLLELINQVLEMSRIESGKTVLELSPADLIEKTEEVRIVTVASAGAKGLKMTVRHGEIPHKDVLIDVSRTNQIVTNILGNAVKYTPEGGSIDYFFEELPYNVPGYGLYRVTVTDTGIGMSEEYLGHIFEEFTRENTSTVSHIQGTGLGMPIVKKLIDLMGGTIEINSKPGEGTAVITTIPMKWDTAAHTREQEKPESHAVDFTGKRLLLVEDNEMNREIATDILEEAGFTVESAEDGDIAVDAVKNAARAGDPRRYDAILMDIQMPRMNGYEAAGAIRALPELEGFRIPIIALSANAFEEDRRKSLAAGMDDHVSKPIDIQRLKETLAKFL